ncbi:MAG: hypothetical protein A2Z88_03525 [Omnitrophica WOR_2 bacterium GWA2_47_8]|nr:MAG: hypothetical protein A2Z88_03525 [Omnitrophica WOR_2 bacterium GWA2_47_8]
MFAAEYSPITLYQSTSPNANLDIRINKDIYGITYITFKEVNTTLDIQKFREIVIPNLNNLANFILRDITLPPITGPEIIVGCDEAVHPTNLEVYYYCGVSNGSSPSTLKIWIGKSPNATVQPQWQQVYTVNASGEGPAGINLLYDHQFNKLVIRYQTWGFFSPPASMSIYEMEVNPQNLTVISQPQIITGQYSLNTKIKRKAYSRYSGAINAISFPIAGSTFFSGARFQSKISGIWSPLLDVPDAENVQLVGSVDSNPTPTLSFFTSRITWATGPIVGADTLTAYIFSGTNYRNLQTIPIGQVNNPGQEMYSYVATLERRYSTVVPFVVRYEEPNANIQEILFSKMNLSTGIFQPLNSVRIFKTTAEFIGSSADIAIETVP